MTARSQSSPPEDNHDEITVVTSETITTQAVIETQPAARAAPAAAAGAAPAAPTAAAAPTSTVDLTQSPAGSGQQDARSKMKELMQKQKNP